MTKERWEPSAEEVDSIMESLDKLEREGKIESRVDERGVKIYRIKEIVQ